MSRRPSWFDSSFDWNMNKVIGWLYAKPEHPSYPHREHITYYLWDIDERLRAARYHIYHMKKVYQEYSELHPRNNIARVNRRYMFDFEVESYFFTLKTCLDLMALEFRLLYDNFQERITEKRCTYASIIYHLNEIKREGTIDSFGAYMLEQNEDWLQKLSDIRNFIIHHGTLEWDVSMEYDAERGEIIDEKHMLYYPPKKILFMGLDEEYELIEVIPYCEEVYTKMERYLARIHNAICENILQ